MTLRERDIERLATVHPDLKDRVLRLLAAMDALGHPMTVTDSLRTEAEQAALFAKGRIRAADGTMVPADPKRRGIVTNADGIVKRSNHQAAPDGWGHAVDCTFLIDGPDRDGVLDTPTWDETHPWQAYGACAEALGLTWGGRWKLVDMPHVELR